VTDAGQRLDRTLLRSELEALAVESAYLLDRQRFDELIELFTEDCELIRPLPPFTGGSEETLRGRKALRDWYSGEAWPDTPRTMRHAITNFRLHDVTSGSAGATIVLLGYRYEGPGISVALPMMVGDYEDGYRLDGDGCWRIHRRRIVIGFLGQTLLDAASAGGGRS
jgi:3-phenylpropionate/cinnamic acid dioxygenase small subunit